MDFKQKKYNYKKDYLPCCSIILGLLFTGKFHSQLKDIIKKVVALDVMEKNHIVDCTIQGL